MKRFASASPSSLLTVYVVVLALCALNAYKTIADNYMQGDLFAKEIGKVQALSDFVIHYMPARETLANIRGQHINIYDFELQDKFVRPTIAPIVPRAWFIMQYPPHYWAIVLPLAFFPTIGQAFIAFDLFWLVGSIVMIALLTAGYPARVRLAAGLLALSSYPVWQSFRAGQNSFFVFTGLVGMLYCFSRHRKIAAGLAWCILTVKVQYVPMSGLIGLAIGKGKYLLGCIIGGAIILLYTAACVGWDNIIEWPHALVSGETNREVYGINAPLMHNFRGMFTLATGQDSTMVHVLSGVVFLFALVGLAVLLWKRRDEFEVFNCIGPAVQNPQAEAVVAFGILLLLGTGLHVHAHDYMVALIPCWIFYRLASTQPSSRPIKILYWTALSFPGLSWLLWVSQNYLRLLCMPPFLIWTIWGMYWLWRSGLLAGTRNENA